MPNIFQNNWAPKMMPNTNLALTNDFNNYQLQQMQNQGYANQQQVYPQNQGYPPQNQGYPPQNQGYTPNQGYPNQGGMNSNMEQT